MRKLLVLLLICLLSGVAGAQVNVFFLPESGFLRVEGQITMEPTTPSLSFLVFPSAQITEFWADELETYHVEQRLQGTVVTFTVQELRPQILNFSYEGFFEPSPTQVTMDRDSLWFPEFSFPIHNPTITMQLPRDWQLLVANEVESEEQGSFRMATWQGDPSFTVSSTTTLSPIVVVPSTTEFLSKIQIQITRLTSSVSARNESEIKTLLSSALQQEGLAHYLASLPISYGKITSEFLTKPTHVQDEFKVIFTTEKGPRFQASMTWQEYEGRVLLQTFSLTPYGLKVPAELLALLDDFVHRLQVAVQTENRARLKSFLGANFRTEQMTTFLANLNSDEPWSIEYVALEPLSITVLVPHSTQSKLLLNIELVPGEDDLLINALDVVPLG